MRVARGGSKDEVILSVTPICWPLVDALMCKGLAFLSACHWHLNLCSRINGLLVGN